MTGKGFGRQGNRTDQANISAKLDPFKVSSWMQALWFQKDPRSVYYPNSLQPSACTCCSAHSTFRGPILESLQK